MKVKIMIFVLKHISVYTEILQLFPLSKLLFILWKYAYSKEEKVFKPYLSWVCSSTICYFHLINAWWKDTELAVESRSIKMISQLHQNYISIELHLVRSDQKNLLSEKSTSKEQTLITWLLQNRKYGYNLRQIRNSLILITWKRLIIFMAVINYWLGNDYEYTDEKLSRRYNYCNPKLILQW